MIVKTFANIYPKIELSKPKCPAGFKPYWAVKAIIKGFNKMKTDILFDNPSLDMMPGITVSVY